MVVSRSNDQPCLGNPWDETIGLTRPLDQTEGQKHAIRWSNEQAVGLRDHDEKYDRNAKLKSKTYKSKRNLRIGEAEGKDDPKSLHYVPSENESEPESDTSTKTRKEMNKMAKEAKTKNVSAQFEYDGIQMTITSVIYDYEIEEGVKDLANQVKLLSKGGKLSVGME